MKNGKIILNAKNYITILQDRIASNKVKGLRRIFGD